MYKQADLSLCDDSIIGSPFQGEASDDEGQGLFGGCSMLWNFLKNCIWIYPVAMLTPFSVLKKHCCILLGLAWVMTRGPDFCNNKKNSHSCFNFDDYCPAFFLIVVNLIAFIEFLPHFILLLLLFYSKITVPVIFWLHLYFTLTSLHGDQDRRVG